MAQAGEVYTNLLKSFGVQISMSAPASPHENALSERLNGIIKNEYLNHFPVPKDLKRARKLVDKVIKSYNEERPHLSFEMDTPSQAHEQESPTKKSKKRLWKNKKKNVKKVKKSTYFRNKKKTVI